MWHNFHEGLLTDLNLGTNRSQNLNTTYCTVYHFVQLVTVVTRDRLDEILVLSNYYITILLEKFDGDL